ncbi:MULTISPECIES: alpha/beta fold hydrolase [unclassified Kitasatospora]|uniref:alpha/beta fold hydrolase n=1 Tax=unclassified Kitasatospora TaxID=2633591 RepID=UPI000710B128|nr:MULTISPECIES: alpha/beta hydrolase [unclassified Kitasatospora]KQV05643.1 alpha/beta hydrolase [Kitasatospora sp. Root107]KRB62447.1 alpha/beta hydrolase [Kitasatospora sp. Root187]
MTAYSADALSLTTTLTTTVTGAGPGLVLAHGAGGSVADNFGPLIPVLARNHTVVGSDYPTADEELSLDGLADALVAAAVEAGVERFTVIGFSLGSAVAVRAATRHPDRVRGLVLAAGFARADNRFRLAMELWQEALVRGDRETFARLALTGGFGADFVNALPGEQLPALVGQVAAGVPGGTRRQAELAGRVDTTAELAALAVPVLVVNATRDLLVDPANSRQLAAGIPGAEYVEIDAGHVFMVERPEEWETQVAAFLREHGL